MTTPKITTSKSTIKEFYSYKEAIGVVREHELKTMTTFCHKGSKLANFGNTLCDFTKNHKILWGEFLGKESSARKPFIVVNCLNMECIHAPDRHIKLKEKLKCKREAMRASGHAIGKARNMVQNTKKMGCPVTLKMKEVVYFPEYQIPDNGRFRRESMSKKLRTDIKNNTELSQERRIIVYFPALSDHRNHVIGENAAVFQNTDERLKLKLTDLVGDLITDTSDIKNQLEQYVKCVLFADRAPPDKSNRRFYPTKRDIQNHVALTLKKLRKSNIDEEKVKEILFQHHAENPDYLVYFRPSANIAMEIGENKSKLKLKETLLIVYQTSAQKRLLALYGNNICLLDATYKTIKYPVPLFLVCVKTNIDYQAVGMFILETELTEHICEGLQMLREANPTWNPKYFVTYFSDQEVNAVESVFTGCHIYLSDFHREQEWYRWLTISSDGVSALKDEAMAKLQRIAQAQTEEILQIAYENLEASDLWKNNSNFQHWFSSEWYPQQERWVWAFHSDEFIFGAHTNNGIACQHVFLKHQFLKQKRTNTLSSLLATIIHEFFAEQYQDYQASNIKFSSACKMYSEDIPDFLQNRPRPFVLYCMERIKNAENYTSNQIEKISSRVFRVRSESQPEHSYSVNFGTENQFPSCECDDWLKTKLLCKHFFAVFANTSSKWDDVSELYRGSKYLCLDKDVITSKTCKLNADTRVPPTEGIVSDDSCMTPDLELLSHSEDVAAALPIHNYAKTGNAALACREKLQGIRGIANGIGDEGTIELLNAKLDDIIKWLNGLSLRDVSGQPLQRAKLLSDTKMSDNKTAAQKLFESILQNEEHENQQDFSVQHRTLLTEVNASKTNKRKRYKLAVNISEPECQLTSEFGTEDEPILIIDGEYPVPGEYSIPVSVRDPHKSNFPPATEASAT